MNNLDEVNDNNNSDGVFDDGVRRKMLFGIASLNSEYIGKLTSQLQEYEQYRDDPLTANHIQDALVRREQAERLLAQAIVDRNIESMKSLLKENKYGLSTELQTVVQQCLALAMENSALQGELLDYKAQMEDIAACSVDVRSQLVLMQDHYEAELSNLRTSYELVLAELMFCKNQQASTTGATEPAKPK